MKVVDLERERNVFQNVEKANSARSMRKPDSESLTALSKSAGGSKSMSLAKNSEVDAETWIANSQRPSPSTEPDSWDLRSRSH